MVVNFKQEFLKNVTAKRMINNDLEPEFLIPHIFTFDNALPPQQADCFFSLLAGGHILCSSPFSFSFAPLNCYFLLYTKEGSGKLHYAASTKTLSAGSLYFFDCRRNFSMQAALLPWDFQIYFITGTPAAFFGEQLSAEYAPHCTIPEYASVLKCFHQMLSLPSELNMPWLIQIQNLLNNILSFLYLDIHKPQNQYPASIPSYLLELKEQLDFHYEKPLSLDDCQEQFQMNKYRICREFSAYFGEPPLRYLNHKRIDTAKEMLLSTELNVHEISSMIGYDNVNHFINMFKKQTGYTPAKFRQTAQQDLSVSRSPVQ